MSMNGMLRQLDEPQLARLLANPDDVLEFLGSEPAAAGAVLDIGKAWHGVHFLLTGEAWDGTEPACYLIAGGETVGDEEENDVGYGPARGLRVAQVRAFAQALAALTAPELARRYNGPLMDELDIYPGGWQDNPAEESEWLTTAFTELQEFVG